jgi:hypothetical protein
VKERTPILPGYIQKKKKMNQEAIDQFEDLRTKLDDISKKLEIITLTTNFVSNMLSVYIIYRSISWVFR